MVSIFWVGVPAAVGNQSAAQETTGDFVRGKGVPARGPEPLGLSAAGGTKDEHRVKVLAELVGAAIEFGELNFSVSIGHGCVSKGKEGWDVTV
jgi:hypothetical protein